MATISAPTSSQLETKAALLAYLDALALAEPIQADLWQDAHLTLTQLSVLRHLRSGPQTAGRLGELAGLSATSISRLVDRLERRGLVSRKRAVEDRRIVDVQLTPAGERLLGEARVFRNTDLHHAVEQMSADERRSFTSSLTRLVELTRQFAVKREERP